MSGDRASCKHLTHKYASFNGCTLEEAFIIIGLFISLSVFANTLLSLFLSRYLGGFMGAFLLGTLLFIPVVFFCVKKTTLKAGKIRKGRPTGFIKFKVSKMLHEILGVNIPYIIRNGKWSTRRTR